MRSPCSFFELLSDSYIAVHFLEMYLLYLSTSFFIIKIYFVDLWLQLELVQLWQCLRPFVSRRHCLAPLPGLRLLLGYRFDYTIHGIPYTSAHVLIENTLVPHKMAKNSRMVLTVVLPEGTNQCYGLHDSACISVHSALVMVLGSVTEEDEEELEIISRNKTARSSCFCCFQVSYLNCQLSCIFALRGDLTVSRKIYETSSVYCL